MRFVALTPLCFAAGCYTVSHRPGCEDTPTDVADDEATDLGTAAGLLAPVPPEHTATGTSGSGDAVEVTVTIARGDGTAEWVDSQEVDVESHRPGLIKVGDNYLDIAVRCADFLAVPVDVTVTAEEPGVAWSVSGDVRLSEPDGVRDLWYVEPFDTSGLPLPEGVDPDDWDDASANLELTFDPAGEPHGAVRWNGERVLEDGSAQSASQDILTW